MGEKSLKILSNIIFKPASIIAPAQYSRFFYNRNWKKYYDYPKKENISKQNIELHSDYGYVLKGIWYKHQEKTSKVIFLIPGYASVQLEMDYIAPFFLDLGYDVVTFNTYAYGNNKAIVTFGKRGSEDIVNLYQEIVKKGNYNYIGLYGHSMGANAVLRAGSVVDPIPNFIIANAPFNRLDETIASHINLWTQKLNIANDEIILARKIINQAEKSWGKELLPREAMTAVAKLEIPVLYLHGTDDEMNPFYMSKELLRVTSHADFIPLKDAGHLDTFIKTKAEVEAGICRFLQYVENLPVPQQVHIK